MLEGGGGTACNVSTAFVVGTSTKISGDQKQERTNLKNYVGFKFIG